MESGMRGKAAQHWAISNQATLHFKAPRQKAWLVERHDEIQRQSLHRAELQIKEECLIANFTWVLATVTFMHNALIGIDRHTPYQALFGRQPNLLPLLEGGYIDEVQTNVRLGVHQSDFVEQCPTGAVRTRSTRPRPSKLTHWWPYSAGAAPQCMGNGFVEFVHCGRRKIP